jgi:hypothetical protein
MTKSLRKLHLYLGCFFAPMLLFFTVSGIWQTFGWNDDVPLLKVLSTLHKNEGLKTGENLNSPVMAIFVVAMSLGLIFSIATGIYMAFAFGRARAAWLWLGAGILVPVAILLLTAHL